jgi:hypothetical protein
MNEAIAAAMHLARELDIREEARVILDGVILESMDRHTPQDGYLLPEGYVMQTHRRALCAGDICCVHNPSDHPLRDAPRNWRGDRGLMERVCPHGIGHPDPDDLAYKRRTMDPKAYRNHAYGVHGCDGCCMRIQTDNVIDGDVVPDRLEIEG